MRDSLEQLWDRICDGDPRAWKEVVVTFTPLVLAVARRSGLSQSDAEDCAQYTWYSLYRSRCWSMVIGRPAGTPCCSTPGNSQAAFTCIG